MVYLNYHSAQLEMQNANLGAEVFLLFDMRHILRNYHLFVFARKIKIEYMPKQEVVCQNQLVH